MRTRQKRVASDTWRSLGCRTTPLEHWSRRKPTVEPRWAKQQTKKPRPKPTKINSFMSGPSLSLTPEVIIEVCRKMCSRKKIKLTLNGESQELGSSRDTTHSFTARIFKSFPKDLLFRTYLTRGPWSCIAHLSAEDTCMLKSAVIDERTFKNIESD